ncbi:hypothetical protein Q8A67_012340 [Cirrhinus molitorella]|uniref:Uncharacterized protein n=1 Tax=Cirrhinus molitorella TaxID=172907 RepID=A0AA88TMB4_9TELE|nr:hypothetical protein Q8A67_012340 [Cirrhinus molitorella]
MAFVKEESQDFRIEEVFSLKPEDPQEQTGTSKERTRRYRERLNQDEARREEILRERRRKYQEKKARGEIKPRHISSLPKQKRDRLREVWRNTARRRKMRKDLEADLDEKPPSPEQLEMSHDSPSPQAAHRLPSTHAQSNGGLGETHQHKVQAEMRRLRKENKRLQAELERMRKASRKMRVRMRRWNKVKKAVRLLKKAAAEKKQNVIAFLSRDENSRLLAGEETHKMQRRLLTKTLLELHADYNETCAPEHCISYRQFASYRPRYITEAAMHRDQEQEEESEPEVLQLGRFIIVKYDDKRCVGQIVEIQGEEIQVNCMAQHGDKNAFQWPEKEERVSCSRSDITGAISEPYGRAAKLADLDWLMFISTT